MGTYPHSQFYKNKYRYCKNKINKIQKWKEEENAKDKKLCKRWGCIHTISLGKNINKEINKNTIKYIGNKGK